VATAYGSSILVMMASPFVLLAILAFMVYRGARRPGLPHDLPQAGPEQ